MYQATAKAQIEANLTNRFGSIFKIGDKPQLDLLSSGLPGFDALTGGGLPRGAITECIGPVSSGRMSLLITSLANATIKRECCAMVDTSDRFDPQSAARAGVDFNRLLWVRCGNSVERAFKSTDLLLHSGGFGFVGLNLADVAINYVRRIMSSWWFRFRRAIENTPTVLLVISPIACTRSCASMILETARLKGVWPPAVNTPRFSREAQLPGRFKLSLVEPLRSTNRFTHTRLLTTVEAQLKLTKPGTWAQTTIQFDTAAQL